MNSAPTNDAPRRWWTPVLLFTLVAALAGASGWAGAVALRPADDPLAASTYTFASVEQGEVGSSLSLNTVAVWQPSPVGANQSSGVVTGVNIAPGDEVAQGSVLYTVDLRPVVIAIGDVPAFRSIAQGTRGQDVAQLQSMLQTLGIYNGTVDGDAGAGTARAIRTWQESLGVPQTGIAELGDVIFVPTLPTRVSLDTTIIARGLPVAGGEQAVRALPAAPTFTIPMTDSQAAVVPTGTSIEITAPDKSTWLAVTTEVVRDDQTQTVVAHLAGADGKPICVQDCAQVPVAGEARLASRIVTVPTVEGLVVPAAALATSASGDLYVVDEAGEQIPVTVVASARGMSVVDGVTQGTRVRVPGASGE